MIRYDRFKTLARRSALNATLRARRSNSDLTRVAEVASGPGVVSKMAHQSGSKMLSTLRVVTHNRDEGKAGGRVDLSLNRLWVRRFAFESPVGA